MRLSNSEAAGTCHNFNITGGLGGSAWGVHWAACSLLRAPSYTSPVVTAAAEPCALALAGVKSAGRAPPTIALTTPDGRWVVAGLLWQVQADWVDAPLPMPHVHPPPPFSQDAHLHPLQGSNSAELAHWLRAAHAGLSAPAGGRRPAALHACWAWRRQRGAGGSGAGSAGRGTTGGKLAPAALIGLPCTLLRLSCSVTCAPAVLLVQVRRQAAAAEAPAAPGAIGAIFQTRWRGLGPTDSGRYSMSLSASAFEREELTMPGGRTGPAVACLHAALPASGSH